jgi:hypothetical protein
MGKTRARLSDVDEPVADKRTGRQAVRRVKNFLVQIHSVMFEKIGDPHIPILENQMIRLTFLRI